MRKCIFLFVFFLFFLIPNTVNASLITVDKEGEVIVNVLALQDGIALTLPERSDLSIKNLSVSEDLKEKILSLKILEDKTTLEIENGDSPYVFDVTNWSEDLIEIEERGSVKKIKIYLEDGRFVIEQDGFKTKTEFSININPEENKLSVETSAGSTFLSILPIEAAKTALRLKSMSLAKEASLKEKDIGILAYEIKGEKQFTFLGVVDYSVDVVTEISASTGEVLSINQPVWLKIYNLLLG